MKTNYQTKKQDHTHCLNECVQTLAPICNLRTPLLAISVNIHVFTGPSEISEANFWRQEIQDMPAVWHEKIAWLCHTDVAQPFIDKLVQSVLSPCHPASSSKIRWDVTNPTIQVILGCRKFPWLNINKGLCVRHVSPSKNARFTRRLPHQHIPTLQSLPLLFLWASPARAEINFIRYH